MKEGRGKPKKENAKTNQYRLRMSDEESAQLEYLAEITGLSKAQIIRKALNTYFNLVVFRQ